jgi:hypothetical protein
VSKPCQDVPAGVVITPWTRKDVVHLHATVLALHPYRRVEHRLCTLYELDERPCLPCTVAGARDEMMPRAQ